MKKIAFFGIKYFPSRGGTSRVAENLILNLVDKYDITIYCYRHPLAKSHIKGVKVVQIPELKLGSIGVFLYFLLCFLHIRLFRKYDIIHAHKIDSFLFLKGFSKKTKIIATAHEAPYKRDKWSGVAKIYFRYSEKQFLSFNGIKTSISKPLCDHYKKNHNIDVKFIKNGINLSEAESTASIQNYWPKGVSENAPFVFFAARRIMGTKGLHTMLEAYRQLNYKGHIFVAGELDYHPAYVKKVKELSKGLQVHYLGFVEPLSMVIKFVEMSDYFIFPSETEGMSIMLLEVASAGKSIVASDIPENQQVFSNNEVLYFKNKNVGDLVSKILWVQKNTSKFNLFGKNAQSRVAEEYTWDKIVLKYKSLYESIHLLKILSCVFCIL